MRRRPCGPAALPNGGLVKTPPRLGNQDARRLFLDRHRLLRPDAGPATGHDLTDVLDGLGFVQVDSVMTLARAHDLILWSRRGRYRPSALARLVSHHRTAFEHWTHDAAVIPMAFYPMWRLKFARDDARLAARWTQTRRAGWTGEIDAVLRHIADHGPASSLDVGGDGPKQSGGWWDWHPSKAALEFLWRSGRLAICHREGFRKFYDLAERVIPPERLNAWVDDAQIIDWALTAALQRLGFATSGELAAFFDLATPEEAKAWCRAALASGCLLEVDVEMADGSFRRSVTTAALLDSVSSLPAPPTRVRLLSPFDPALRDRARAERLFGFHYRIEIFVPEAKRQYGYYVFPILEGDRLLGRMDVKRVGDTLRVRAFWPEAGVRLGKARIARLHAELERVKHLAGTTEVTFCADWLRT
ncbi:MAG: crosslink repair DNA glycosylase YcaQ family protein [Pseudomonadota bacterium]